MKTKSELADFLRNGSTEEMIVTNQDMVEILGVAASAKTVNEWLATVGLNFEASFSHGTVPQWIFRRPK
jgi:hypothetical protein